MRAEIGGRAGRVSVRKNTPVVVFDKYGEKDEKGKGGTAWTTITRRSSMFPNAPKATSAPNRPLSGQKKCSAAQQRYPHQYSPASSPDNDLEYTNSPCCIRPLSLNCCSGHGAGGESKFPGGWGPPIKSCILW